MSGGKVEAKSVHWATFGQSVREDNPFPGDDQPRLSLLTPRTWQPPTALAVLPSRDLLHLAQLSS